jgi:hypothetical protein
MSQSAYALAIWSDVAPDIETDYRHWLTREHMRERVGVDGFISGRAFCALDRSLHRYFIVYELTDANVLSGSSYLARLNDPTPWSRRMMPELQQFSRGGGAITAAAGLGHGGAVVPLRFDLARAALEPSARQQMVERIAAFDGICRVWLLEVDRAGTTVATDEKRLRKGGDKIFDALVVIEGVDAPPLQAAAQSLLQHELAGAAAEMPVAFSTVFAIDRRSAALNN